ncbi:M48 family peptidase [Aquitalea sp. S1-19]|nr:M48 family peptidase [Aquitalea sp. S1-19]
MKSRHALRSLILPEGELAVVILRRPRKSIVLRMRHDALEVVAHPQVPVAYIRDLLIQRTNWIRHHWQQQRALAQARVLPPSSVHFMGRPLPIVFCGGTRQRVVLDETEARVYGFSGEAEPELLRAALARALSRQAVLEYPARLGVFAPRLARQMQGWQLSGARTRWGSCTAAGKVRLNWRLIQAPAFVLDYVMAHELAHLAHLNHSPAFWAEVARLLPAWQTGRDWLKAHGNQLFSLG